MSDARIRQIMVSLLICSVAKKQWLQHFSFLCKSIEKDNNTSLDLAQEAKCRSNAFQLKCVVNISFRALSVQSDEFNLLPPNNPH